MVEPTREIRYIYPDDEFTPSPFTPDEEYGPRFLGIETARLHGAASIGLAPPPALAGVYIPTFRSRRGR